MRLYNPKFLEKSLVLGLFGRPGRPSAYLTFRSLEGLAFLRGHRFQLLGSVLAYLDLHQGLASHALLGLGLGLGLGSLEKIPPSSGSL